MRHGGGRADLAKCLDRKINQQIFISENIFQLSMTTHTYCHLGGPVGSGMEFVPCGRGGEAGLVDMDMAWMLRQQALCTSKHYQTDLVIVPLPLSV